MGGKSYEFFSPPFTIFIMVRSRSAQLQLDSVKAVDQTTFRAGDTWYVVEMSWMVKWLQYMFQHPASTLDPSSDTSPDDQQPSTTPPAPAPAPGPVTNQFLFDQQFPPALKTTIALKQDYRVVCSAVWDLFVEFYGTHLHGPTIAISKKEHLSLPHEWDIQFNLPPCLGVPPPQQLQIELVPHVHTVKCNRRVSVCDTPGRFREREIVRVCGKTGEEKDRIVWWKRRRRLGEDHGSDDSRDEPNLDTWEQIPGPSVGQTQYVIRMEEHEHMVRAQYVYRTGENSNSTPHVLLLSNTVGPCEESGPMIHAVKVVGEPVVGGVLIAEVDYWGGVEGKSSYQWTRVKEGVRKKGDIAAIDSSVHVNVRASKAFQLFLVAHANTVISKKELIEQFQIDPIHDPRCHVVTEDDINAKFKVSCTPKNQDGMVGEPKTSRPTAGVRVA